MATEEQRKRANQLVGSVRRQLTKWEAWFPNEERAVDVPRVDLLALIAVAEEAATVRDQLLAVARGYEQWEADMILCDEAWRGGMAPLPTLTQPLWDRLLELQAMRNAALAAASPPV